MALDGGIQFSERFEANYHEMMAHVPVHAVQLAQQPAAAPDPSAGSSVGGGVALRALVLGGGDGGVLALLKR